MPEHPEHLRHQILSQRARALAQPLVTSAPIGAQNEHLMFAIGGARYALEVRFVFEVVRTVELIKVPRTSLPFLGITPFHGEFLAVIDVPGWLGVAGSPRLDRPLFLACGDTRPDLAIAIDEALELRPLDPKKIIVSAERRRHGLTDDGVRVIDGSALTGDPQLARERNGSRL